jgi:hypothetical protein
MRMASSEDWISDLFNMPTAIRVSYSLWIFETNHSVGQEKLKNSNTILIFF